MEASAWMSRTADDGRRGKCISAAERRCSPLFSTILRSLSARSLADRNLDQSMDAFVSLGFSEWWRGAQPNGGGRRTEGEREKREEKQNWTDGPDVFNYAPRVAECKVHFYLDTFQ